jgi:hypothetical protein
MTVTVKRAVFWRRVRRDPHDSEKTEILLPSTGGVEE